MQQTRTAEIGANSYIWQPWFATVGGNLALNQSETSSDTDTQSFGVTGSGNLLVFPSSRFPFEAFFDISDSQLETDSIVIDTLQTRRTRVGVLQRYRTEDGRANYSGRVERITQSETFSDTEALTNRLALTSSHRLERQSINLSGEVEHTTLDPGRGETLDVVVNGRHDYQVSDTVSLQSFATLTDLSTDAPGTETRTTTLQGNSFAFWRPTDRPLTVSGNLSGTVTQLDVLGVGGTNYNANASVNANYEFSPELRGSGTVTASASGSDSSDLITGTSQFGTLTYTPPSIELAGFNYNWFTSATAGNTISGDESNQNVGGNVGHGINRSYALGGDGRLLLTVGASQNGGVDYDTRRGLRQSVGHGASAALSRSAGRHQSRVSVSASDSRTFGSDSNATSSATLQANHETNLDAASFVRAGVSFQVTRQELEQTADTSSFSSANVQYGHRSLFGVPRLRFSSELRAQSDSLIPVQGGEEDRVEITWENRLDYSIGRVVVRFRGLVTQFRDSTNTSLLLTISRNFGGVY